MSKPAITQIGVVVHDLQATMEAYHSALGWGPWRIHEHRAPELHDLRLHGERSEFSMLTAETEVGPISFELIQPLDGPSPYSEWLQAHGEGLHHVAYSVGSTEEVHRLAANLAGQGAELLTRGKLNDVEFFYFDTQPLLKMIIETATAGDIGEPARIYPPPAA